VQLLLTQRTIVSVTSACWQMQEMSSAELQTDGETAAARQGS
jgi:hypothetical protein